MWNRHKREHKDVHICDTRMPSASHAGNILIRHFYWPRGDLEHQSFWLVEFLLLCLCLFHASSHRWNKRNTREISISASTRKRKVILLTLVLISQVWVCLHRLVPRKRIQASCLELSYGSSLVSSIHQMTSLGLLWMTRLIKLGHTSHQHTTNRENPFAVSIGRDISEAHCGTQSHDVIQWRQIFGSEADVSAGVCLVHRYLHLIRQHTEPGKAVVLLGLLMTDCIPDAGQPVGDKHEKHYHQE